jgi:hypothetical protein
VPSTWQSKSGGEAVQVSRTSDYSRGLSKIIGNLTARYSLGFTLAEEERMTAGCTTWKFE